MPRPREAVLSVVRGTTRPPPPSADKISAEEFRVDSAMYDMYIKKLSDIKTTKPGDKSLSELDTWRYGDAIRDFSGKEPKKEMGLEDVMMLVNWKLKHGKFRPTLMKLVSSNEAAFVKETIQEATKIYWDKSDVAEALKILTKLKGIGPATASLLLAVIDPERVIFFADEAFWWLCCDAKRDEIKYTAKEYETLTERTRELCKRLNVKAVDVERVAYVKLFGLSKMGELQAIAASVQDTRKKQEPKRPDAAKKATPAKRKDASDGDDEVQGERPISPPARRSKRVQKSKEA